MPYAPDLSGHALDDRYELHAVIGEGAFGRVYRGRDRRLERTVAVKLIKPWWSEDPEWARSFEREAQLLARVSDPGIVQIFDVGQAPEGLYYVSELIDGESLASRLDRGALPPWTAATIAEQLCRALARAHAEGIVHRDVKPANILIAADGQVKVGDFGVARLAEGSSDGAGATVVGTPRYMAPEQARGWRTTPATDVYSAGVVLYEMIAGRPPFTERSAVELALRHLRDTPPALPAATPAPLVTVTMRALAKAPTRRYADCSAMAHALAGALGAAPLSARSAAARGRARTRTRARAPQAARVAAGGGGRLPRAPALRPPSRRDRSAAEAPTRRAPRRNPRRNLDPAGRRRSLAALAAAFLLLGAMLTAALILGGSGRVRVPSVLGWRRGRIEARARSLALAPNFARRYSAAPLGTAIAQRPRAGGRVTQGSSLRVVLSAGLRPVRVPQLAGQTVSAAQVTLTGLGLRARVTTIAAPGVRPGTITSQSPAPGAALARSGAVSLDVAETPQWRALASLSSSAQPPRVSFPVHGTHWRIVYSMSYQGTCTLIFICSGPTASVSGPHGDAGSFELSSGTRQTQSFAAGAGPYTLTVAPGSDSARWSVWVEDWY